MTHWLTPDGYNVMLRGLMGDAIKFTRIKYGNGTPGDGANDLKNPLLSLKIASATRSEKYVTLSVSFKNVELEITGFWATEIGIYVEDPDDSTKELCYCIWEETEVEKADYINPNVERLLASQYDFVVFVSEAKNVSAALGETLVYATVTELNNHKNDKNNPHKVTKEQIGLGNVENKALIDQTPTFATAKKLSDISSGEKMGSILGKIAKALSLLKSHLSDFNNPHKVKAADIGAAASTHSHNANDINDGTVIVQRGGTGRNEWTKNCIVFADGEKSLGQVSAPSEVSLLAQGPDSAPVFMKLSSLALFVTGNTPPTQKNLFWIDPTPVTGGLKYWNGTDWEHVPVAYS